MSRGLRPVGSAFETLDEGVEINLDTHAYSFEGTGVVAATDPVDPNLVHVAITAGSAVGAGAPTTVDAGDVPVVGLSPFSSHEDHEHGVNTALAANLAAVDAAAAAAGVSATIPRGDHKHTVTTGVPVSVGTANAPGVADSLARSDHVHALAIQQRTYQAVWPKDVADILGTTTTVQRAFDRNGMVAGAVWTFVAGFFMPNAAVPAGAMGNTATLTIVVRTAAGVIVGTLGTITVGAAWGANVPQAVVAGAVLVVNPGEYLTIAIAKTGVAGRVIPAGALELTFTVS